MASKLHYLVVTLLIWMVGANENTPSKTIKPVAGNPSYRLLCFLPVPMKSHQKLFEPLVRELVAKGHRVTLVTPMPLNDPPKNLEQVVIKNQYENLSNVIKMQGFFDKILPSRLLKNFKIYFESFFDDPVMKEFLASDRQFDGIVMEILINEFFVALHHKYNAPFIDVMPLPHFHWCYYLYGIPFDTSYIVDTMIPYTDHMSFSERLLNTGLSLGIRFFGEFLMLPQSQELMDKHLRYPGWETRPPVKQMIKNVSMVLINTHYSISYSYPLPPHAKEVAGVNIPPVNPLPKELQIFMDNGKEGVIVFSFGSHISMEKTLGPEKLEIFRRFFGTLKQNVLWKTDEDIPNLPANVKTTKWFPQPDLLGHPNTRLFISHCGYHSAVEIIYNGLPALAIPVQADQGKNAKMLTHYGIALTLQVDNITETNLAWALNRLLTDPLFKENAVKRSKIYRDQKERPIDTAVYWIEYVLRHEGAHHLKPAIMHMPWYQQALLDVYAALALILFLPLLIIYYILKFTICRCCRKTHKTSVNKKRN